MTTIERDRETSRPGTAPGRPSTGEGRSPAAGAGASERERTGASRAQAAGTSTLPHADELVGELMPEEVDWEHLVRSYPVPALAIAAAAGFYLGLKRGPMLVGALTGWATGQLGRKVSDLFEQDLL